MWWKPLGSLLTPALPFPVTIEVKEAQVDKYVNAGGKVFKYEVLKGL